MTYKYDPFGRRIEKTITDTVNGTRTTKYVYDREDILFELDGNNNIVTEFVHGPGIDEPIAMIRNNQTYYYHADGLGSIIAITDSAGQVVQRYEYDSFGNITYQQDTNFVQPYTYTGREYDNESGLYYYRARYYDAKVGRFLQQDPIRGYLRNPQSQNRYIYVLNNPLKFIDPFGHVPQSDSDMYVWRKLNIPCPDCTPADYERAERYEREVVIPRWKHFIENLLCEVLAGMYGGTCIDLKELEEKMNKY